MLKFNDSKSISIKKIKIVVAIILIGIAFRFVEKRNHFFEKIYVSYCGVKNINDKSSSFYDLNALINNAFFYHIMIEDINRLHIQVIDTGAKIVAKNYDYNYNIDMKFDNVNGVLTDLSKIEMGSNKFETKNHFQSADIKISSALSFLEIETLK